MDPRFLQRLHEATEDVELFASEAQPMARGLEKPGHRREAMEPEVQEQPYQACPWRSETAAGGGCVSS